MKLPLKAAAAFFASPRGRRAIKQARAKLDTPENRERARAAMGQARTRLAERNRRPSSPRP